MDSNLYGERMRPKINIRNTYKFLKFALQSRGRGGVSNSMDGRGRSMLALDFVLKNLIFA